MKKKTLTKSWSHLLKTTQVKGRKRKPLGSFRWTSFSYERLIVTVSVVVLVLSKVLSELGHLIPIQTFLLFLWKSCQRILLRTGTPWFIEHHDFKVKTGHFLNLPRPWSRGEPSVSKFELICISWEQFAILKAAWVEV